MTEKAPQVEFRLKLRKTDLMYAAQALGMKMESDLANGRSAPEASLATMVAFMVFAANLADTIGGRDVFDTLAEAAWEKRGLASGEQPADAIPGDG